MSHPEPVKYFVWDTRSANLIAEYESLEEAIALASDEAFEGGGAVGHWVGDDLVVDWEQP